jgi:hypothetical protein
MGIRNLNRFLRENARNSIKLMTLGELSGKTIAIDTSIYMHKYASEDCLIENIYQMIITFKSYNINPLFIFDGKPPAEKSDLLEKRKQEKNEAREEYKKYEELLKTDKTMDEYDRQELSNAMDVLKRSFVNIKKSEIEHVKKVIECSGYNYYVAEGEADELCAYLCIQDKVWGCLSEDMDMFVYGCPRVFRYLSLMNHTVVLYDLPKILNELEISEEDLRMICVLSGTDYNSDMNSKKGALYFVLKQYKKYYKQFNAKDGVPICCAFTEWALQNKLWVENREKIVATLNLFTVKMNARLEKVSQKMEMRPTNKSNQSELNNVLKLCGFLFAL